MARRSALSGKKANIQRSGRHKSGKSRSGGKAFAPKGPHGLHGIKNVKNQGINLVKVKIPGMGSLKVTMKEYKTHFKRTTHK